MERNGATRENLNFCGVVFRSLPAPMVVLFRSGGAQRNGQRRKSHERRAPYLRSVPSSGAKRSCVPRACEWAGRGAVVLAESPSQRRSLTPAAIGEGDEAVVPPECPEPLRSFTPEHGGPSLRGRDMEPHCGGTRQRGALRHASRRRHGPQRCGRLYAARRR